MRPIRVHEGLQLIGLWIGASRHQTYLSFDIARYDDGICSSLDHLDT